MISDLSLAVILMAGNFLIRNWIISDLSMGESVTEARLKSGAKITVAFALHQKISVFTRQGRVNSEANGESNRLNSRQHAKLISNAGNIMEELCLDFPA